MKPSLPLAGLLCLCLSSNLLLAQDPPIGFASVTVSGQWNEAVGLTFTEDGLDMFVWERAGKLWVVRNNQRSLLLDITEEVGGWHDHGFLGFALHPHFDENGQIYLLYLVDRHHLKNFGTGAYNPSTDEFFDATIGRLTRYTTAKNGSSYSIVPGSRKVLIGETITTGIPVLSITHSTGSLVFGTDHTLLVSTGDGASPSENDIGSAATSYYVKGLADGIIRPKENVGAFRSQIIDCYNGKILRIDPETGAGLPSNPFYDPADPNSRKSKVWALGLRNPFRMSLKPETGSHNPSDGNPGILYVGDVGWNQFEEVNVVDRAGLNFGWPIYEGYEPAVDAQYSTTFVSNQDAPNPLYQVNGCNRQYFYFQDLLKQETPSGTATFPNPCNSAQNIPSSIPTFVHRRPILAWRHCCEPARVGTFNGQTPATAFVRPGASPVPGPEFQGRSSTGGVFYRGADFAGFQNTYFFGDYTAGWIRNITMDGNDRPLAVKDFVNQNSTVVAFATHPTEEGLYYVNFPDEIRKIYFSNNRPPVAIASSDKKFGPGPLQVQFQGSLSQDFENQPLTYEWNFGDGTPLSNVANPSHTFDAPAGVPTKRTVTLKVTDNQGASNQTTLVISINNTPPQVEITSPVDNSNYPITQETTYTLIANVSDTEHSAAQLTYRWQTILHHADHEHPSPPVSAIQPTATISPLGCDGQEYFYRITLTVTDEAGGSTTKEVRIYPDCNTSPSVANPIPDQVATVGLPFNFAFASNTFSGSASTYTAALSDGNALPAWLTFNASTRTFSGTPAANNTGTIEVRVTATNGNGTANDLFNITVNLVAPLVANPIPDQVATVGLPFNFAFAANTFSGSPSTYTAALSNGNALPAWLTFDASTRTFSGTPASINTGTIEVRVTATNGNGTANDLFNITVNPGGGGSTFYRGINLNGTALVIDGNNWEASTTAPGFSFTNATAFANQAVTLIPATDANRATMIRSSLYGGNIGVALANVPNGNYQVYLYVWEDNNATIFTVRLEGVIVQGNYNSGPAGTWAKLGPYPLNLTDGTINVGATGGAANFSGLEVWSVGSQVTQPSVANPIPDQVATVGYLSISHLLQILFPEAHQHTQRHYRMETYCQHGLLLMHRHVRSAAHQQRET
jgi:glucose/arabinose dehydrogenase